MKGRGNCNCISRAVLCLFLAFLLTGGQIQAGQSGSIRLKAALTQDSGGELPLKELTFVLYQVGEAEEGHWKWKPEYAGLELSLEFEDAAALGGAAKALAQYIEEQGLLGENGLTDDSGMFSFEGLCQGIYLLVQEPPPGAGYICDPSLLCIPMEIEGNTVWQLEVEPKFETVREDDKLDEGETAEQLNPEQSEEVQEKNGQKEDIGSGENLIFVVTGDNAHMAAALLAMGTAALLILFSLLSGRGKERK